MIHSPVMALIWERWRRTRWVLIAAILLPFSGWLMHEADYSMLGGIIAVTWLGLGTVALTAVLLLGQCEARNLDLAFPKRLFRFPVRTVTLLAVNMGYGVVTIALPLLIIIGLGKLFGDIFWNWWIGLGKVYGEYLWKWWIGLLWLETVFVAVQAMAWLRGAKAVFFFLVPSLTGVFMLLYLAAKFGLPMGTNILCPVIIVLCCAICFGMYPRIGGVPGQAAGNGWIPFLACSGKDRQKTSRQPCMLRFGSSFGKPATCFPSLPWALSARYWACTS